MRHVVLPVGYRCSTGARRRPAASNMQRWAKLLGLGPHRRVWTCPERPAASCPTPAWRRASFTGWERTWYEGDSVNLAVGQGGSRSRPLQLAVAYAALANGGTVVRPHVARAVVNPSGACSAAPVQAPRAPEASPTVGDHGTASTRRLRLRTARRRPSSAKFQPAVCGKDRNSRGAARGRPLVVRVVGAVQRPALRRGRRDPSRRLRRRVRRRRRRGRSTRRTSRSKR